MPENPHTIYIRLEPFGVGYDVTVDPPVPGFAFDAEYPTYREARTYARGIRLHRGFPIVDETGEDVTSASGVPVTKQGGRNG